MVKSAKSAQKTGRGSRGAYKEGKKALFLQAFVNLGVISKSAKCVHISPDVVYNWIEQDPAFAAAFKKIDNRMTMTLEDKVVEKALDGNEELLKFLLKARNPQKYTERMKHEIEMGQVSNLIAQTWAAITRVIKDKAVLAKLADEFKRVHESMMDGKVPA